jgi:uncharacterized protein (TIGR02453 family)
MSDGFAEMVTGARAFFARLSADNTKSFYEANKRYYLDEVRKPATLFADLFAEDIARHTGKPHGPKVFRLHRDVRFSKDKTPYNTHLHILWQRPGDALQPAWFFGADPGEVALGMGVIGLEKESLADYRRMIDRDGDALSDELDQVRRSIGADLADWGAPALKRVPKPFSSDHPHSDLLRRKAFVLRAPLPDGWEERGLIKTLNTMVPAVLPIWARLSAAFGD